MTNTSTPNHFWGLDEATILPHCENRINVYDEGEDKWFNGRFLPTLELMTIDALPWEDLLAPAGPAYLAFYQHCVQFNQPHSVALAKNGL